MGDNLRGSLFMIAAMAGFAVEDMFLKAAARSLPTGEVLMLFGLGGLLAFVGLTRRNGQDIWSSAYLSRPILVRSGFEVTGRLFYTLAFVLTPLTFATAILQATPLVVVAGAALFLGERVGWRRWTAIGVGLAGVLLILRPGLAGFEPLSVLALLGMLGFAGRDLATRAAPPVLSNAQLGICGFSMLTLAGAILATVEGGLHLPDLPTAGLIAAATVFGVFAYNSLTIAMRTGEVGAVTPWRYTRLVFGIVLGATVFGERPDTLMIAGSVLVVGSGVFALVRTRKVG
ncbi:DMT family transporter [Loktanella sp. IMCC34160]|uniref:DMT family transporter n=1 Tax=Loktanella sp. IMCC34160 TaxID=2510646 RepID=UPI00101B8BE0|nr:DMT family transporter [Loktanella sp. IMCC34160]RYG91184.1 DMT family transporter [Loktanella sp. IMCC34160]